jgi:class 3 adenylate cyclase
MGRIILEQQYNNVPLEDGRKFIKLVTLTSEQFDKFNPAVLDLGDISTPATQVEALAAIFDLSGFTTFCSQVDPHLAVPEYLSRFLNWLFDEIRKGSLRESNEDKKVLWASLPFLAKFLGDGVLFLWDTKNMGGAEICNVVTSLWEICANYVAEFYPIIKRLVAQPPKVLRCGISRGMVFSVGNGEDYVGPCINIGARLQKLSSLTFCFSRRGFDIEKHMPEETASKYVLKSVALRGIGENELVWVRKEEFDILQDQEKALFRNP